MTTRARGYSLIVVMVLGTALSAIAGALLLSTARDRVGARKQANVLRALYGAEAAVAYGVDQVREQLATNPSPSSLALASIAAPALPDATFETFRVSYINPATLAPVETPARSTQSLTSGPFRGMFAQRSPIEVRATPTVNGARANLSDYVNVDLIPVFQFAIFSDQEIEYMFPEPSTVVGRLHSNTGIYFGTGANRVSFVNSVLTTAGRVHLRDTQSASSQTSGRAPTINGTALPCDNAASGRVACPSTSAWLAYTESRLPAVRDEAHGVAKIHLPTGLTEERFTDTVRSVPDLCGDNASGVRTQRAGVGRQLSPDWLAIDLPRDADTTALRAVKFGHMAGLRVIDGQWEERTSTGAYNRLFHQRDASDARVQCLYYGHDERGGRVANSDGVPAIRDARLWDYQDRRLRRVQIVDVHRLTRCLPQLEQSGFNGIVYFGEDASAARDNWGIDPDERIYAKAQCERFRRLPAYLRGQYSSTVVAAPAPAHLKNDDFASVAVPVLDNPYYPASGFCVGDGGDRRGLGDGPYRLPQGDGDGRREPGRNELVETGFLLRNAQRIPTATVDGRTQGFTFATNMPVYLQGDVNIAVGTFTADRTGTRAGKVPFAVVSDAVTFLSDKYNELQENPFAPVGPLAVWQAIRDNGADFVDEETTTSAHSRHWSMLALARADGTAPTSGPTRFDSDRQATAPSTMEPSSPAPCVNLLRELVLRRQLVGVAGPATGGCASNCGLDGVSQRGSSAALRFGRDWLTDFAGNAIAAGTRREDYVRAVNAFVAFAPLEELLDTSMYALVDSSVAGFSSQQTPTDRNDREALRDWMRCTLDSGHPLADDGSAASLTYPGGSPSTARGVLMGATLQGVAVGAAVSTRQNGMRAATAGSAAFDVSYAAIVGHNGYAPFSVAADKSFTDASGNVLFTRDRSSLRDGNGMNVPASLAADLSNLSAAADGDPLVLNVNLLTGTTWMCPEGHPYPTAGANYRLNGATTNGGLRADWKQTTGSDEGLYGIYRYQENWYQVDTRSNSNGYIDFFINGSTIVMFNSRESNGRHLINQGYMNNIISGCGGGNDNNHTAQSRSCRLSSGYEYAWESSRRSLQFDADNADPAKLPPGTPKALATSRIRWVRR